MAASRHLWVGGLPEHMSMDDIRDFFSRYGKVESVKLLPLKHAGMGLAAFVDFHDLEAAKEAHNAEIKIKGTEVRTNYKSFRSETKEGKEHSRRYYNSPNDSSDSSSSDSDSSGSSDSSSDSESDSSKKETNKNNTDSSMKGADATKKDVTILKITNLPNHKSDREILKNLHAAFDTYSDRIVVKLLGDNSDRYCLIKFKRPDECSKAFKELQGTTVHGMKIRISLYNKEMPTSGGREHTRSSHEDRYYDDIDPNATRSLFVGNIPKNISIYELRDYFQRYGPISDVEIKKMSGNATYGFILFYDLPCAINAKKFMDGAMISGNKIRVGFGKGTSSKILWVDCVDPSLTKQQIEKHFSKYGRVSKVGFDKYTGTAMVQYESIDEAKDALSHVKGTTIGSTRRKVMVDFANNDAKVAFFAKLERIESHGGGPLPPHPFHSTGPMYPMDRMSPMIVMPPHGPSMDYYRPYPPYMEDYYGYHRPPPPHLPPMHRGYLPPYESRGNYDDYEDELRAFSRKRERERRIEREEERRKKYRKYSSDDSVHSDGSRARSRLKGTKRSRSSSNGSKKDNPSSSDERSKDSRAKTTRKSLEHREKQRNRSNRRASDTVDRKEERKREREADQEKRKEDKEVKKEEKEAKKEDKREAVSEEDEPPDTKRGESPEKDQVSKKESNDKEINDQRNVTTDKMKDIVKPKVIISYEEDDDLTVTAKDDKVEEMDTTTEPEPSAADQPLSPSEEEDHVVEDIPTPPVEAPPSPVRPPPPPPPGGKKSLLPVTERQKITIAWKERGGLHLQAEMKGSGTTRIESDLSSGDDFEHMEDDASSVGGAKEPTNSDNKVVDDTTGEQKRLLSHSSEASSDGTGGTNKRTSIDKIRAQSGDRSPSHDGNHPRSSSDKIRAHSRDRSPSHDGNHPRKSSDTNRRYSDDKHQRGRHEGPVSGRGADHRSGHHLDTRHHSRYHHESRRRALSPPQPSSRSRNRLTPPTNTRSRSPPLSPPPRGGRPRTPIQRPPRHRPGESPRGDERGSGRRHNSPPARPSRRRDRTHGGGSPYRRDRSPIRHGSPPSSSRYTRQHHKHNSPPSPSSPPPRRQSPRQHRYNKKEDPRSGHAPSRPRTPSGSPPPQPPVPAGNDSNPVQQDYPIKPKQDVKVEPKESTNTSTAANGDASAGSDVHDLLRRYPVMWQGHFGLKNEMVALQLHFLSGNSELAQLSLPVTTDGSPPTIKIFQRMKMEQSQLDGVENRIKNATDHCLLLAFPCGRDAVDYQTQAGLLTKNFINYLLQKQAAGIVNVQNPQGSYVLHIFPPCPFSTSHLSQAASDLLNSTNGQCHLMIIVATNPTTT